MLIHGPGLASRMIDHEVGVNARALKLPAIVSDSFAGQGTSGTLNWLLSLSTLESSLLIGQSGGSHLQKPRWCWRIRLREATLQQGSEAWPWVMGHGLRKATGLLDSVSEIIHKQVMRIVKHVLVAYVDPTNVWPWKKSSQLQ